MSSLTGLQKNGLVTVGVLVYVLALIGVCEALVSRKVVLASTSRKIVHVGAASWLIFWPLYDADTDGWSWRLNVLVPAAKGLELFVKGAIIRDPNDNNVRSISRSGNPTELLYGPFQFTVVMTILGLCLYRRPESCLIMGALGVGDGIAPIVGSRFGRHRYVSPGGGIKTVEGSAGVFAGTIVGYYIFSWILSLPLLSFPSVCISGLVAATVEGLTPSNVDNITIPAAMYVLHSRLT